MRRSSFLRRTPTTLPLIAVDQYADDYLAQQISQVPGVAQVAIGGEQRPAIRIQVDPAKLATRGLTLEDIRGALVTATTDAPKGSLTTAKRSFTIDANDQITDANKFEDVILSYRNGAPVRVRDVGRAVAAATDRFSAAYYDNKPAILLSVYKQPGANVIATVERIKALLPKVTAVIPPAVKIDTVLDRTTTIRASVDDVEFTLLLTIVLVVLVVLLFLRHTWATLVPAFTIALSLLGAFAAMYAFGFSLDNLSLMALMIAIGFVVDDAIVEVENVFRHIEDGTAPLQAAIEGSAEIRFTVLSISASLIAVFIPLLLMGGIVGRLFFEFAVTVMAAVAVSALRIAVARPDAVRALSWTPRAAARPAVLGDRGGFRRHAGRLSAHPRRGSAASGDHARGLFRDLGADGHLGCRDSQRVLPHPGYRNDQRPRGGCPGCFTSRNDAAAARVGAHPVARLRESQDLFRRPEARAAMATRRRRIPRAFSSPSSRAISAS